MTQLVKVRIRVEGHLHQDLLVPKGAVLELSPKTAEHLTALGIAEPAIILATTTKENEK